MARIGIVQVVAAAMVAFAGMEAMAEVKDGSAFRLGTMPNELVAERRMGEPVRFSLEENASTGFRWDVESSTNECTVVLKHCGGDRGATCGAPGRLEVAVTSLVRTPVCVEFRYRRPWEKDVEPWKTLRLVVKSTEEEQKGGGGDAGNLVKYHNE
jgi:predicted secreted protein